MTIPMFDKLKGKKLYRSPRDGMLFGICAGLAHYLDIDVVFVRLIVVVLTFLAHIWPVVLVYAVGMFLIPIDPSQDHVSDVQTPKDVTPEPVQRMDQDQNM
ncbi:MAG TPA: PspC domain-containing protein [Candidatus Paceibacterota bacterium]|nr:PspC domain-containing protein [Candidatus Paceibacterota bacterium]